MVSPHVCALTLSVSVISPVNWVRMFRGPGLHLLSRSNVRSESLGAAERARSLARLGEELWDELSPSGCQRQFCSGIINFLHKTA